MPQEPKPHISICVFGPDGRADVGSMPLGSPIPTVGDLLDNPDLPDRRHYFRVVERILKYSPESGNTVVGLAVELADAPDWER